jgi:protease-4
MSFKTGLIRFCKGFARWVDRFRRFLHLLFLLFVLSLVATIFSVPQPVVPASAALVLDPAGTIVDQLSGDPIQRALAIAQGVDFSETLLADLIEAVHQAEGDRRIKALVLSLDGLRGAGLSKLMELGAAIEAFKASGKPIYAIGSGFDRNQYFLAAYADEILMHPMGLVLIDGYSSYIPYYKSALEKVYVDYNAWTVGEFKSFVEPYTRDDMSEQDRESRGAYLNAMWDIYQREVERVRGLDTESLQRYADEFVPLLRGSDGDTAQLAVDFGLIDETLPFDEIRTRIRDVVGAAEESSDTYAAIGHRDYLTALRAVSFPDVASRKIGLIVASGTILDGMQPPGTIGGESLARLIRRAGEDPDIRALVLRIDSPGGSAFASELILRELEVFQQSGRPIVVSMGSVAASGGYWIAMNADEIWASPSTLTGSIGVGARAWTFDRTLAEIGINVDGVSTTRLAGQMDPMQGVGEDISEYIQLSIERTYEDFVSKVALHREREPADIEAAAQGRVWIGTEAQSLGLVDNLGGLDAAIESAAELAGLTPNSYSIDKLAPELGWAEQLALRLIKVGTPAIAGLGIETSLPPSLVRLLDVASEPLAFFESLNDPRGIYAYCFCDVR